MYIITYIEDIQYIKRERERDSIKDDTDYRKLTTWIVYLPLQQLRKHPILKKW